MRRGNFLDSNSQTAKITAPDFEPLKARIQPPAYAGAGVNIALGNRLKATLPALLARTHRREVLGKVGGFGGLFALDVRRYRQPVLVSSVDGVGTKLKVAFALNRHDTVGHDLVNHCVNDIAVLGAEPLFFLDYLGAGALKPRVFTQIIQGFVAGCAENGCALIGGETAQMPGFYAEGEYDLAGTIVGVVEKREILDGRRIRPGDAILGLASSGLHTNGYSLARKIVFEDLGLHPQSYVAELGQTVGEAMLEVHASYGPLLRKLRARLARRAGSRRPDPLKGLAHITGGGFIDNIPRILPKNCDAWIEPGAWEIPPIFRLLQRGRNLPLAEWHQVFNMGIGMVAIVAAREASRVLDLVREFGQKAWRIGEVRKGTGKTRLALHNP